MHKGFAFYSPHQTMTFFLKAVLLSFWIGLDVVAALVMSTMPDTVLVRYSACFIAAIAILAGGTVFSCLWAWLTGSLFGTQPETRATTRTRLISMKRKTGMLLGAGVVATAGVAVAAERHFAWLESESDPDRRFGRANLAIAKKCAEVASFEKSLFQTDEQIVMAQCLLQYDKGYAALHVSN
ncbi:MAG: hypothetical protein ACREX0_06030 [Noviherbaspirillum sp.]